MPEQSKKTEYQSAPKTKTAEANFEPDVTHSPGVTGTPISIEPVREDPAEPHDPEGEHELPPLTRGPKFVHLVSQGKNFRVLVELKEAPTKAGAGVQVSFWDSTAAKVMDPVFVPYDPAGGTLTLDTKFIAADAPIGDVIIVARMAVADSSAAGYHLAGEKRRCRVGSLKIVP